MKQALDQALASIVAQGLTVEVKPLGWLGDLFVIHLASGTKYALLASGILKLKAEGRLNAAGIERTYGGSAEVGKIERPLRGDSMK